MPASLATGFVAALFHGGAWHPALALTAVLLAAGICVAASLPRTWTVSVPVAIICAFCLWLFIAARLSSVPYISVLTAVMFTCALTAALVASSMPQREWDRATVAIGAAMLAAMGFAVLQFHRGDPVTGPLLDPNSFAALTAVAAFLVAATALARGSSAWIGFAGLVFLGTGFVAGLYGSRSTFLALSIGLALLLAQAHPGFKKQKEVFGLTGAAVAGLLASLAVTSGRLFDRAATLADPGLAGASRFMLWESGLKLWSDSPWYGIGPGTLSLVWPPYRNPGDPTAGNFLHNDYLHLLVEGGVPAVAILCLLGIALAYQCLRKRTFDKETLEARVLFICFAALAVTGLTNFNLYQLPFLVLAGAAAGRLCCLPHAPLQWRRWTVIAVPKAAAVLGAAAVMVYGVMTGYAAIEIDRGKRALAEGRFDVAELTLRRAVKLWPSVDLAWYLRGDLYRRALEMLPPEREFERRGALGMALRMTDTGIRHNAFRTELQVLRGRIIEAGGALSAEYTTGTPADHYAEALRLDPRHVDARLRLAGWHANAGRDGRALEIIDEGLELRYTLPHYAARLRAMREALVHN